MQAAVRTHRPTVSTHAARLQADITLAYTEPSVAFATTAPRYTSAFVTAAAASTQASSAPEQC